MLIVPLLPLRHLTASMNFALVCALSHREPAAVWAEEPPDAGEQAKRLAEKAASLDAAAAAAAEKRARLERETRARLEQLRNLALGEAIGGAK